MIGAELANAGELTTDEVDTLIEHIAEPNHDRIVNAEVVDEPQEATND